MFIISTGHRLPVTRPCSSVLVTKTIKASSAKSFYGSNERPGRSAESVSLKQHGQERRKLKGGAFYSCEHNLLEPGLLGRAV